MAVTNSNSSKDVFVVAQKKSQKGLLQPSGNVAKNLDQDKLGSSVICSDLASFNGKSLG